MKKRKLDPIDGVLIGIAEVAAKTGFSTAQIRSWRKAENYDKAVFEALRDPYSETVWYRLADIEDGCELNGKTAQMRAIPAPNAFKSTRVSAGPADNKKRDALDSLVQNITTENSWAGWNQRFTDTFGLEWNNFKTENLARLASLATGRDVPYLMYQNRFDDLEGYYKGIVATERAFWAQKQGFDLTDAEIVALPVGAIPPIKETK